MVAAPFWRRPRRLALVLALAGFAVASAAGGCDCQGSTVNQVAPKILVTPTSITFPVTAVKAESDQVVTIENNGSDKLTISPAPTVVEGTEDNLTELALRQVLSPVDCATGKARSTQDPTTLLPGQCDTVTVVYVPKNIGTDTGKLVINSNDPKTPEVDVPITASGSAPKIQVCLLAGSCVTQKICNQAGKPLNLPFPLTAIGATTTCKVSIDNLGKLPLKRLRWGFKSGNRYNDYTLDPADLSKLGDLAAGQGVGTQIHFSPRTGGDHPGIIELTSSDPVNGVIDIDVDGKGDGPRLCPDPVPTLDFGKVTVGTPTPKSVKLTDCGTQPLSITDLQVQDATGSGPSTEYKMGSPAPSVPIQLAANQSTHVPVVFTPDAAGTFNGRLFLKSNDPVVSQGWVNLTGQGQLAPACELQVATKTLDFGSAATGYPSDKVLAVSNPGQLPCTGVTGKITAGAAVQFSVIGFPPGTAPYTLKPGDIVTFKLEYDPADATGPDAGTFEVSSSDIATPIDVALKGTPVKNPTCQLAITPKTGNFNVGGACSFTAPGARVAEFGAVRLSKAKTITASLENTGSIACTISSVKMVAPVPLLVPIDTNYTLPDGNQVAVNGTKTNTIQPGQVGQVPITLTPTSTAGDCGALQVQTNDNSPGTECNPLGTGTATPGCHEIVMQGTGVQSAIQVIPSSVKFGLITVGCASLERTVTVYNTGQASLNVTAVYIDPPGKGKPPSGPFTITSVPPLPAAIPGGGTLKVKVKYRPANTNGDNALLTIESDATNANIMTVPLSGTGTTNSHQTDHFTQLSQPEVDVLWMIDDSCSMGDKQQNVANQSQTFFQRAITLNTDYHLAVVTTDMDNPNESGKFQTRNGAPKIITPSTPNPVQAFSDNALLGTNGSGHEQGLAAIHAALTAPLVNGFDSGFLRDPAKLVVIAVSDEDDQSPASVAFYVDFLKNIKGFHNADLMSFSAIVGYDEATKQPAQCNTSTGGQAVPGPRYVEVTQQTNGLARSICSTNWGKIADDLGLNAFGARAQFFLTREAVASSIVVHVNGQQVSQPAWSYDAPSNSVIFDPSSVPPQSATITVDYDTVCH